MELHIPTLNKYPFITSYTHTVSYLYQVLFLSGCSCYFLAIMQQQILHQQQQMMLQARGQLMAAPSPRSQTVNNPNVQPPQQQQAGRCNQVFNCFLNKSL